MDRISGLSEVSKGNRWGFLLHHRWLAYLNAGSMLPGRSAVNMFFLPPRPNGEDRPIAKERGAYPILKCLLGNLSESMNNSLNANVLRTTFASAAFELGITTDIVNAITGHFNSIHALQKVATGAYVKTTAEGNRKWFNMINEKLLNQEIPFDAFYEEPAVNDGQ